MNWKNTSKKKKIVQDGIKEFYSNDAVKAEQKFIDSLNPEKFINEVYDSMEAYFPDYDFNSSDVSSVVGQILRLEKF